MKKTVAGLRTVAILEVLLFLGVLLLLDIGFGSGHRFLGVEPHPLWVLLLLILFQYSINEAIMTIVLMCLFLYWGNLPPQQASQSLFDYYYSLSLMPILWLSMTVLLGGLKLRNSARHYEMEKELKEARSKERVISDAFNKLKSVNRTLEMKLSEELASAVNIYKAAMTLERLAPENQMDGLNRIVASIMNPEKFSIFTCTADGLIMNSSYAWGPDDKYSTKFGKNDDIYRVIVGEKRIVAAFQEQSRYILGAEGVIAGPLIDEGNGEVFGMLKIEEITFSSFNSRTVQLFKLLCEWFGVTLRKMAVMREMSSSSINSQEHRSYSYAFLQAQTEFLRALARRIGFHLTELNIRIVNAETLDADTRRQAALRMSAAIKSTLRRTDQLFDAQERGEEYALLLCGTGPENVHIVISKIQEHLRKESGPECPAQYAFSYQVLYYAGEKQERVIALGGEENK